MSHHVQVRALRRLFVQSSSTIRRQIQIRLRWNIFNNNLFHNIIPYTQIIPVSADHDRLPPHLPRTSRHGSRRYRIRTVIGATMVD